MDTLLRLDAPVELTTAATDLLLAMVCLSCIRHLARRGDAVGRLRPWSAAYGLFAIAAVLGAGAHALLVPDGYYRLMWAPIYLALSLAISCFLLGVVHDVLPDRRGTLRPVLVGLGLLCFVVAVTFPSHFVVFLAWQGLGLAIAIAVYGSLWLLGRLPGAGWICLGLVISVLAALVQGTAALSFTLIWPFDHNGVFHLIQLPGLAAIAHGLVQTAGRAIPVQHA